MNNFIYTHLAAHLGLTVQPSNQLRVTVRNGVALGFAGVCLQVPLKNDQATFSVDIFLLPIHGADVVLGVQWLSELGPIAFDYQQLWMKIDWQGP